MKLTCEREKLLQAQLAAVSPRVAALADLKTSSLKSARRRNLMATDGGGIRIDVPGIESRGGA